MSSSGGGGASASGGFEQQQQQHTKRRPAPSGPPAAAPQRKLLRLSLQDDDVAAGVVPPVTVVLDGRCISHRVHLNRHSGYRSLAGALRRMFVDDADDSGEDGASSGGLDLANAVPGHLVAYEDMEDDLLLAGDLKWSDFVRVAKRIRIIPAKTTSSRTKKSGGALNN